MRIALQLSLSATAMAAVVACNPPLLENEPPSIRIASPIGLFNENLGEQQFFANADLPIALEVLVRDRDGDTDLTLDVYLDDTPGNADDEQRTELATFPEVTAEVLVNFSVAPLPAGSQVLEMVAGDGAEVDPTRTVRFQFEVTAALEAPVVEIDPPNPTTIDPLNGLLITPAVNPGEGDVYHEYRWIEGGQNLQPPDGPGQGFPAFLNNSLTQANQTWEFCVSAFRSANGTSPDLGAVPVIGCDSVTILPTP